jgi:type III secretion system YscD/HrpQ family protein
MGLLFKVLSGPHQGAEFDILEEEVAIGATDECDVVVSDALVANRHMKLKVVGGNVFVTPQEGNVFIAGKLLREPSYVDPFQFLTIGATHMMFGEADSEQWKSTALGEFPELEKVEEEVSAFAESDGDRGETANGKEAGGEKDGKKGTEEGEGDIEKTELTDREGGRMDRIKKPPSLLPIRKRIIRYAVGFTFCLAIAITVSVVKVFFGDEKSAPMPLPLTLEQRVQKAIDALKLKGKIKVSKVGDGPVSVTGYVETMANSMEIKTALKAISEDISVKLLAMEKVISSAMEIVKESKQNVVLKKSEDFGEIIATGYIKKEEIWTKLKEGISSIKGITNIRDEILTKTSVVDLAKEVLERHKFKNKLEATATDEGVEIKGTISDTDKENWTKTREDFEKTFKRKAQLNFTIAVSTDRNLTIEKFFGGKIDSVNFNSQGLDWVNIKGGNKYFQGSVLPSGYVIDQVEQDSVTIRNADEVIKLDLEWM